LEDRMKRKEEIIMDFENEVAKIPKLSKTYNSANIIDLTVGKIERSGDWGNGGRTYIKIEDHSSTAAMVLITDTNGEKHIFDISAWESIEILAGGGTERKTLSDVFTDIGKYLKDGIKEI